MAGNVGYAKSKFVLDEVNRLSIYWFQEIEKLITSPVKNDRFFAIQQLKGLIEKTIPQNLDHTSDGNPIPILPLMNVPTNNSNNENNIPFPENTSNTGGNVSQ